MKIEKHPKKIGFDGHKFDGMFAKQIKKKLFYLRINKKKVIKINI